jgi:hypothetical protein
VHEVTRARLASLEGRPGLSKPVAREVVRRHRLPELYEEVLQLTDGAEGFVGANYLRLFGSRDLADEDEAPPLDQFERLSVFGSNGAGEAFAFNGAGAVVMVPWIGGAEDVIAQGSFDNFVQRLHDDLLFDRASA